MPPADAPVRVTVANDYELVVRGVAAMLAPFDAIEIVELKVGDDRRTVLDPVDVVLFDTFGRVSMGISTVRDLVGQPTVGHVAVYTWESRPHLVDMTIEAGASACISKAIEGEKLVQVLIRVARGERLVLTNHRTQNMVSAPGRRYGLSDRECEVLALVATGMRNQDIAAALYVSANTVKTHLLSAYRKLGVRNRAEAAAYLANEGGLLVGS